MSDIKNVLSLLCRYLNLSVNVSIKPEYFRLAKFNDPAINVTETLWMLLDVLSCYAVQEKRIVLDFQEYDKITAIKLCFACLQYPVVEFYALTENDKCNRHLLIAFAWLVGAKNVLDIVLRSTLADSILGRECSYSKTSMETEVQNSPPKSLSGQVNNVIHLNGRVNYNIREISELLAERTKLIDKVHAASRNVSGLPHLSVSELALVKKLATANKNIDSNEIQSQLKEISAIGNLLDTHMKWKKKEHVFFDWITTVIQEQNKSVNVDSEICWQEVSKLVSLLRHIIEKRLESLTSEPDNSRDFTTDCASRLLRTPSGITEAEEWLKTATVQLTQETEELCNTKEMVSNELKDILRLIPSCVQI